MKKITLYNFRKTACAWEKRLFSRLFPDGMSADKQSIRKALEAEADPSWLIYNVLPTDSHEQFSRQLKHVYSDHYGQCARARQERDRLYEADLDRARQEYRDRCCALIEDALLKLPEGDAEKSAELESNPKESVSVDEVITFLNDLLSIDQEAVTELIAQRVPCNQALADHPSVQVRVRGSIVAAYENNKIIRFERA